MKTHLNPPVRLFVVSGVPGHVCKTLCSANPEEEKHTHTHTAIRAVHRPPLPCYVQLPALARLIDQSLKQVNVLFQMPFAQETIAQVPTMPIASRRCNNNQTKCKLMMSCDVLIH
eukprot:2933223-Amphidinium_carterae.1